MQQVLAILWGRITCDLGRQWAEDLVAGDTDCKRLALCLAIELRRPMEEVLLLEHLEKIFEDCTYSHSEFLNNTAHPRQWFESRRRMLWDNLCKGKTSIIPTVNPIAATENENTYVTTIDYYRLKHHYLRMVSYPTDDSDTESETDTRFVEQHPDFIDLIGRFGSKDNPVWVTTKDEIERVGKCNKEHNIATNIMICLGLSPRYSIKDKFPDSWNMSFAVEYPSPAGITTYQPSSLNKDWLNAKDDLYLSYIKKDSFGLTYASDASGTSAKEQIHEYLCPARGLKVRYIGKVQDVPPNKAAILEEGLKRLSLI